MDEELRLDPTANEEKSEKGSLILSLMPTTKSVVQVTQRGEFPIERLLEAMDLATHACELLHTLVTQELLQRLRLTPPSSSSDADSK